MEKDFFLFYLIKLFQINFCNVTKIHYGIYDITELNIISTVCEMKNDNIRVIALLVHREDTVIVCSVVVNKL